MMVTPGFSALRYAIAVSASPRKVGSIPEEKTNPMGAFSYPGRRARAAKFRIELCNDLFLDPTDRIHRPGRRFQLPQNAILDEIDVRVIGAVRNSA
jgi:hypothetical protein